MKNIVLCQKNGFALVKCKDFYRFGSWTDFCKVDGIPENQCGTKDEVKSELERWKNEIDFDNPKMLEVENCFISALS